jgi:hypothetical protein
MSVYYVILNKCSVDPHFQSDRVFGHYAGLGRLKKVQRKARMGRNPQTGEAIQIKAKTVAKFYVAKSVKDAIAPPKK